MIGREFSRLSRSINSERGTVPGRIIGLRILDASRSKPGYGKTTLLSQWAERNGQAFAWVSVDETDNDPKMLLSYRYVAEALDRVEPIGGRVFEALASQNERPGSLASTASGQAMSQGSAWAGIRRCLGCSGWELSAPRLGRTFPSSSAAPRARWLVGSLRSGRRGALRS